MSRNTLLWLVPVFTTLHNVEESIFIPEYLKTGKSYIPSPLRDILPDIGYFQFLMALLTVTIIPYLVALFSRHSTIGVYLLLGFQVVMLINVGAHCTMAVFLRGYAPGLATAICINLPYSIYLLRRARKEGWVSGRAILVMFPIGLLIHGPALLGLMIVAGQVAGRF